MAVSHISMICMSNEPLLDVAATAPSPSKDYCQLIVKKNEVIYRCWKISPRFKEYCQRPAEKKETADDFFDDEIMHHQICHVFGSQTLTYVKCLLNGHIDYIMRIPSTLQKRILLNLNMRDITAVKRTCRTFNELCETNEFWKFLYKREFDTDPNIDVIQIAVNIGWRNLFVLKYAKGQQELDSSETCQENHKRNELSMTCAAGGDVVMSAPEDINNNRFMVDG